MKAYQLIEKPQDWTTGTYAKDKDGNECDPQGQHAICFCVMGAFKRCYGHEWGAPYDTFISSIKEGAAHFNDTHTHAEVLAKLKELDL